MEDKNLDTDNKKTRTATQSIILFFVATIFLIASFIQISEHYSKIQESMLSFTIVILATIIIVFAIFKIIQAIKLLTK